MIWRRVSSDTFLTPSCAAAIPIARPTHSSCSRERASARRCSFRISCNACCVPSSRRAASAAILSTELVRSALAFCSSPFAAATFDISFCTRPICASCAAPRSTAAISIAASDACSAAACPAEPAESALSKPSAVAFFTIASRDGANITR